MNQEIKQEWVTGLRSGQYTQTKGTLKNEDGYCCLGVLCDIVKDRMKLTWTDIKNLNNHYLPSEIVQFCELEDHNPSIVAEENTLAVLNDEGMSFLEIAELIEEHL
jgi:hypothetical protein